MLDKDLVIHQLKQMVSGQAEIISFMQARVTELENNQKKNISNSSKPPGSDVGKQPERHWLKVNI